MPALATSSQSTRLPSITALAIALLLIPALAMRSFAMLFLPLRQ